VREQLGRRRVDRRLEGGRCVRARDLALDHGQQLDDHRGLGLPGGGGQLRDEVLLDVLARQEQALGHVATPLCVHRHSGPSCRSLEAC
jgi:hypothetical protein